MEPTLRLWQIGRHPVEPLARHQDRVRDVRTRAEKKWKGKEELVI